MKAPGLEIRPIRQMDGDSDFNEVFFDDVRVPDAMRLGGVGDGWSVAVTILMNERSALGGGGGGISAQQLLELARSCGAAQNAAVRERIAEFHVRSTGLRYTGYRLMTALSRGTTPGPEASIGKLVSASLQQEMAAFALELQGPAGLGAEGELWGRRFLSAPGARIAGGTDEIMRNIIAERVLRLPPEPRLDKGVPFAEVPTGLR
jgi:alkylation response protein AidB-like acyl-CoA dehydrogenase